MDDAAEVRAGQDAPGPGAPAGRTFLGHPFGLFTLFTTELWERFSYYGMRAILFYFLTDTFANDGLGLDDATGAALVAVYGSAVYLVTVVGGWVADRLVGARRAVLWGGVVITAGHLSLTVPAHATAYLGIVLVALGTGLLKPNVSSMVGELYRRDDPRRDSAFSIFYMGINLGSFTAPFLVQLAREAGGYHAGFSVAAVGMALALVAFVLGRRALRGAGDGVPNPVTPDERPQVLRTAGLIALAVLAVTALAWVVAGAGESERSALTVVIDALSYLAFAAPVVMFVVMFRSPKVNAAERSRLRAYVPLFVAATLFWMIFEQASSTLSQYARDHTDLDVLGVTISPVLYQSVNPLAIIVLAPVFAWLWMRWDGGPSTAVKFAIGLTLAALSFVFLAGASAVAGDGRSPWWVLVVVYVVQTLGELCLSPVGLAATTLLAPKAFRGQAMALWFLAPAAGQALTAQLITATEGVTRTAFFGGIGVVTLVVAGAMFALAPWVTRHVRQGEETDEELAARS